MLPFFRASKGHYWFKRYGDFAELVDFTYWWNFSGEGSASVACAAGLFITQSGAHKSKHTPIILWI